MRVFIRATEGIYHGLHGIENCWVGEIENIKIGDSIGLEMATDLIEDYNLEEDYYDEDGNGDYLFEPEFEWHIYKIRDDVTDSLKELNNFLFNEGHEEFIKKYCEEEELY